MTEYTASTTNTSNTITAVGENGAAVTITVNGEAHTSGTSAVWESGENEVEITVGTGSAKRIYTVTVTKSEG